MTPDEVREIVRDEVVKMLIEAGVVETLTGLLGADPIGGLLTDLSKIMPAPE